MNDNIDYVNAEMDLWKVANLIVNSTGKQGAIDQVEKKEKTL